VLVGHLASMENVYRMAVLQPDDTRHHRAVGGGAGAGGGAPDRGRVPRDRILPMIVADWERDKRTMVTSRCWRIERRLRDRQRLTIAYIPEASSMTGR
jgi:hypothetical protein